MDSYFLKQLEKLNFKPRNKEVIEKTGFNTSDVSRYMSGKKEPSKNFIKKFCEVYNLDINLFTTTTTDEWKEKYYALLEKYNACLEEKETIQKNTPISRPKPLPKLK